MKSKNYQTTEQIEQKRNSRLTKEEEHKKNLQENHKKLHKHLRTVAKKLHDQEKRVKHHKDLLSQTLQEKKEKNLWKFIDNQENNKQLKQKRIIFNDRLMERITKPGPDLMEEEVEYYIK